jgi:hypothetical protein
MILDSWHVRGLYFLSRQHEVPYAVVFPQSPKISQRLQELKEYIIKYLTEQYGSNANKKGGIGREIRTARRDACVMCVSVINITNAISNRNHAVMVLRTGWRFSEASLVFIF